MRKKPFSGAQKKKQLQEKRARQRGEEPEERMERSWHCTGTDSQVMVNQTMALRKVGVAERKVNPSEQRTTRTSLRDIGKMIMRLAWHAG